MFLKQGIGGFTIICLGVCLPFENEAKYVKIGSTKGRQWDLKALCKTQRLLQKPFENGS